MSEHQIKHEALSYQFIMLVLSLYALVALTARAVITLDAEVKYILDYADDAVCVLFFADFLYSLWSAPNRVRYLFTWGWVDLLSSIPMLDAARWGRIARIVRVVRVLRGLRASKQISVLLLRRRAENAFLVVGLLAILLTVIGSIAVLQFEAVPEGNIKTAQDAVWWTVVTITTVGYGDYYPVTPEGRFVAAILMCAGVGIFTTFSGFLAAWFLEPKKAEFEFQLNALKEEITALKSVIESKLNDRP